MYFFVFVANYMLLFFFSQYVPKAKSAEDVGLKEEDEKVEVSR